MKTSLWKKNKPKTVIMETRSCGYERKKIASGIELTDREFIDNLVPEFPDEIEYMGQFNTNMIK